MFRAPTNVESVYITALILALIISPFRYLHELPVLLWAAVLSQGAKYMFAIHNKHLFNPAAIAVVLTAFVLGQSASWWVGTTYLSIIVLLFGLTIVRKIQREDMVFTFLLVALVVQGIFVMVRGGDIFSTMQTLFLNSSLLFFGFVMLTEPLTTPPTKKLQLLYAGIVGVLFAPQIHLGSVYSTPELALVVGNIFSYWVSPKQKLLLVLKEKVQYGTEMIDFVFPHPKNFSFQPGQYMEWTLPHRNTDSRGNRRYFTIASSPTESALHLGVRFYQRGSSFKKTLLALDNTKPLTAGQLAGDFTLPADPKEKLVFIAGGIGITPFRSMMKYCIDKKQKRTITLLYTNRELSEIMYTDVFQEAEAFGMKTFYTLTDLNRIPSQWQGGVGRIDATMIKNTVPDFADRTFYISGQHKMVESSEHILRKMGVPQSRIKKDFFPGYV